MQRFQTRKILVRTALFLLPLIFWFLGSVRKSYWVDSPDQKYAVGIILTEGWRAPILDNKYDVYVRDQQSGEQVLADQPPVYCGFERIAVEEIQWQGEQRFVINWAVQYNGLHAQPFKIEANPLKIKAGAPCCGVG